MPDLVPKILTGVMGEFWDDVPGRDLPGARAGDGPFCGHTACLRPGFVCAAPKNLDRRSCSSLEALMVLARGARGAARTWSRRLWQCSTIRRKPSSRRAPRDDLPQARPPYESPAHISALEASSILRKN
jgi:hypothetical protein